MGCANRKSSDLPLIWRIAAPSWKGIGSHGGGSNGPDASPYSADAQRVDAARWLSTPDILYSQPRTCGSSSMLFSESLGVVYLKESELKYYWRLFNQCGSIALCSEPDSKDRTTQLKLTRVNSFSHNSAVSYTT